MEVGAYEAKTKLSALLDRVEGGEHISITRLRRGRTLGGGLTVRDLIDAGRR